MSKAQVHVEENERHSVENSCLGWCEDLRSIHFSLIDRSFQHHVALIQQLTLGTPARTGAIWSEACSYSVIRVPVVTVPRIRCTGCLFAKNRILVPGFVYLSQS